MAEPSSSSSPSSPSLPPALDDNKIVKGVIAMGGIMLTLIIYGYFQERIMTIDYGNERFTHSLFLVFCNRISTSAVSAVALLASKKTVDPVAPVYTYCLVSLSNILTTTCQYEALKYVSFPVQTLAKCAKMIPVMLWGSVIMQKRYKGQDYMLALLVTLGCALFFLYPVDDSSHNKGRESTVWGVSLMLGYLGFDGFTSTFQDKLFKGYVMEIHNQIFYTTMCSCLLSFTGIKLVLVSIVLSSFLFVHPLSWKLWIGAVIVFASLYTKSFMRKKPPPPSPAGAATDTQTEDSIP